MKIAAKTLIQHGLLSPLTLLYVKFLSGSAYKGKTYDIKKQSPKAGILRIFKEESEKWLKLTVENVRKTRYLIELSFHVLFLFQLQQNSFS